jgi:hypothetical protein
VRLLGAIFAALGWLLATAAAALAISAPIHIHGTGGEGVFIRPTPDTSHPAIGWMPEGASPDFHCFAWGQNIGGVPIWFNVTYNGVTGYYASFYDDSSYHSNEELTAKYGVPLCGAAAPAPPPSAPAPPAPGSAPGAGAPPPPAPLAIYFSPYNKNDQNGKFELNDGATTSVYRKDWETYCESKTHKEEPGRAYSAANGESFGRPIVTLAGWSAGKIGVIDYLKYATKAQRQQINYAIMIDPGNFGEMTCDRKRGAGDVLVDWLTDNPGAHLVIISGNLSQQQDSKGIQESYFNALRRRSPKLSPRVLICNYSLDHEPAYFAAKYWIQHQIGSTRNACPRLLVSGRWVDETAGWHPINN